MIQKLIIAITLLASSVSLANCPNLTGDFVYTSQSGNYREEFIIRQEVRGGITHYKQSFAESPEVIFEERITDGVQRTKVYGDGQNREDQLIYSSSHVCADNALIERYEEKLYEAAQLKYHAVGTNKHYINEENNLVLDNENHDLLTNVVSTERIVSRRK